MKHRRLISFSKRNVLSLQLTCQRHGPIENDLVCLPFVCISLTFQPMDLNIFNVVVYLSC